jgi:hypothetical protein
MKSDWYGTALGNKGFMYSFLCTAALHMFVFGKGTIDAILNYRMMAISEVNKAISKRGSAICFADATLGAIFNLMTVEESLQIPCVKEDIPNDEKPNHRMTHQVGLQTLLHARGGLGTVGSNRILQAFILW